MCGAAEIAERIFERGKSRLPKSLASQFEIACLIVSCLFVGRSDHPRAPSVVGAVHHRSCRALQRPRFLLSSLTRTTRTTTMASLKPKLKPTRSFFPSSTLFRSLFSPLQSLSLTLQACAEKSPVLLNTSQAQTGRTFSQLSSFFFARRCGPYKRAPELCIWIPPLHLMSAVPTYPAQENL